MNRFSPLLAIILLASAISCKQEGDNDEEFLVLIKEEHDIACGLPVVEFLNNKEKLKATTGSEWTVFVAYQMDSTLNFSGNRLKITFEKTQDKDLRVCNTLGVGYPAITILDAKLADIK